MPEPTEHQIVARDILVAYVQAVIAAQDTTGLVQGGLQELRLEHDVVAADLGILERLIDSAKVTITVTWEVPA